MVHALEEPDSRTEPTAALVSRYLPLHAAVYATVMAMDRPLVWNIAHACILWVAGVGAHRFRSARFVSFLGCLSLTWMAFPLVPNHGFVFCFALFIGAMFDPNLIPERAALTQSYRYVAAIVLFWSGVQKAWSGTWLAGQFLAYEIGHSVRFAHAFGWLVTRSERQQFRAMGPYLGNHTLIILGNLVWILEIGLGLGLLSSPVVWQRRATWAALVLLVLVEAVARESIFGLLMLALLLPTLNMQLRPRWLWLAVPLSLLAIGGRLSLVPGGFH